MSSQWLLFNFEKILKRIGDIKMNIIDKNLVFGNMDNGNNPNKLVVHHLEAEGSNWTVEKIHNMHQTEAQFMFAGIGYHYYIRLYGTIYKGRPDYAVGAHCKGVNQDTLGIAFEGNYDARTEMPTVQFSAWCELKAYLVSKHGSLGVFGHREVGSSACPGRYFPLDKIKNGEIAVVTPKPNVTYSTHVQNIGWQETKSNGQTAGTTGKSLRLEGIAIDYNGEGHLEFQCHIQNVGWQSARNGGEIGGTLGKSFRLEAIKISLVGTENHVAYRVHIQDVGWTDWKQDGAIAGTVGESKRVEAIEIKIV